MSKYHFTEASTLNAVISDKNYNLKVLTWYFLYSNIIRKVGAGVGLVVKSVALKVGILRKTTFYS